MHFAMARLFPKSANVHARVGIVGDHYGMEVDSVVNAVKKIRAKE
jgi:hypothetical protein